MTEKIENTENKKPIVEWLKENHPEAVRSFLKNTREDNKHWGISRVVTLETNLSGAFPWFGSDEGHNFWATLHFEKSGFDFRHED